MSNPQNDFVVDYPPMLDSLTEMNEPNKSISVYEGNLKLKKDDLEFVLPGNVEFKWFPSPGCVFSSVHEGADISILNRIIRESKIQLYLRGFFCGECFITRIATSMNGKQIQGKLSSTMVIGERTIPVSKICFDVANFKDMLGDPIKRIDDNGVSFHRGRITLEDEYYRIVIDKRIDYTESNNNLKNHGGYIIQYSGELQKLKGSISFNDGENVLSSLGYFLSFVTGRKCFPLFRRGIHNEQELWVDFTHYFVDPYKDVLTWSLQRSPEVLNGLWLSFRKLWRNDSDRDFIISLLNWYLNAISNTTFAEGSIITIQAALELLYNWLIIEKNNLIVGKDAESISASNKVRLLLSRLSVNYEVPSSLTKLKDFAKQIDVEDGPETFVQIRNAIVHSQIDKRKKIIKMDPLAKYQALQLGLWYIELSLLYILGHQGKYFNRCGGARTEESGEHWVPWTKSA